MGSIKLRVDESLQEVLERIRKDVASDMKKKYGIQEITVFGTLASKVLAAKVSGKQYLNFRINKVGANRGVLEIL